MEDSISKSAEAKDFCIKNGLNQNVAIFVDLSKRSGVKRLFVVNLDKDSLIYSGLVANGHCKNYTRRSTQFSNEIGSNCSSQGRYKLGGKYQGSFGTAYKLYGLDSTNSNAFKRFVVLHAHACVPDDEQLVGICRSEGCPTVSPLFLKKLEVVIDASPQPLLMWIFGK